MRKIKALFKNKSSKLSMIVLSIAVLFAVVTVSASSYTSYLQIGNGSTVIGATRYYTAGTHQIQIDIDSWTNYASRGYTKLKITLSRDNGNSSTLLNTYTRQISASKICTYTNMGYQSASNKYYSFSTNIDGVTYGGVYSSNVVMTS